MPTLRRFQKTTLALILALSALAGCGGSGGSKTSGTGPGEVDTPLLVTNFTADTSDSKASEPDTPTGSADTPADSTDTPPGDPAPTATCTHTGTPWTSQKQFLASNPDDGDRFASAIAMSATTIALGAENEDSKATGLDGDQNDNSASNSGAVYLWECQDGAWRQAHYLKSPETAQSDYFGSALALSGDTLFVGAKGRTIDDCSFVGAVYVYRKTPDGWLHVATLAEPGLSPAARFGFSVALSGDLAVVGAPGDNDNAGKVFFYRRDGDNWTLEDSVAGTAESYLGRSLALAGDTAVTSSVDAALVYERGARGDGTYGWTQHAALSGKRSLYGLEGKVTFNASAEVAMATDRIVVTSPSASALSAANAGMACAFKRVGGEWLADGYCFEPSAADYQRDNMFFGQSGAVLLDNGRIVVTADADRSAGVDGHGSVFVFGKSGSEWVQEQYILSPAGVQPLTGFGFSGIAAYGNSFIVSEQLHSGTKTTQGAAYLFGAQ